MEKEPTYVKSYGGSTTLIENWLENTLCHSLKIPTSSNQESGSVQLKIDRAELTRLGLNKESQDRIYRSFFVFVNGMTETIKEFNHIEDSFSTRLWDVFMRLLDHNDPNHTETFTTYLRQCHVENIKVIESTMKSELEKTRKQNEQLTIDLAMSELQLMDLQYRLEMEVLFNKALQQRMENKLETMRTALQATTEMSNNINDSYIQSKGDVSRNQKLIVTLTASEKNATTRLAELSKLVFNLEFEMNEGRKQNKTLTTQLTRCTEERDRYKVKIKEMQSVRNELAGDKRALSINNKLLKTQLSDLQIAFGQAQLCTVSLTQALQETLDTLQSYATHNAESVDKHQLIEDICNNKLNTLSVSRTVPKKFKPIATPVNTLQTPKEISKDIMKLTPAAATVTPMVPAAAIPPTPKKRLATSIVITSDSTRSNTPLVSDSPTTTDSPTPVDPLSVPVTVFTFHSSFQPPVVEEEEQFDDQCDERGVPLLYRVFVDTPASLQVVDSALIHAPHSLEAELGAEFRPITYNPRAFNHTHQHVMRHVLALRISLDHQRHRDHFETHFTEVYHHLRYLKSRLDQVTQRDEVIRDLKRRLAATQFMCCEYSNQMGAYHTQLVDEQRQNSVSHATVLDCQRQVAEYAQRVDELLLVEGKYVALQDKFAELVEHYKTLAITHTQTKDQLAAASALIADLKVTERAHIASLDVIERQSRDLTERSQHVEYLMIEKRKVESQIETQSDRSSSAFLVFAPLLTELERLELSIVSGLAMYKENQRVIADQMSPEEGRATGSQAVLSKAANKSTTDGQAGTSALRILLNDIKYTSTEFNSLPPEQQPLVVRTIEMVFLVQTHLQALFTQCDRVVDIQLEMFQLLSDLDRMKKFTLRERRRIIKHYEDQIADSMINTVKGTQQSTIVSYNAAGTQDDD